MQRTCVCFCVSLCCVPNGLATPADEDAGHAEEVCDKVVQEEARGPAAGERKETVCRDEKHFKEKGEQSEDEGQVAHRVELRRRVECVRTRDHAGRVRILQSDEKQGHTMSHDLASLLG